MSFWINKSLRNFSNYLILSLALSDLTIVAFSMNIFTTYNVYEKWILGSAMCKAWLSVDYCYFCYGLNAMGHVWAIVLVRGPHRGHGS